MIFGALVLLVGGLVVASVGWLGRDDRLPRQHWAGIRTRTTMTNDETWRAARRAAGWWVVACGIAMALARLVVLISQPGEGAAVVILLVGCAVAGVMVGVAGVLGQSAAKQVLADH